MAVDIRISSVSAMHINIVSMMSLEYQPLPTTSILLDWHWT